MRVLVTGAAGFLGKSLVEELLRDGYCVRALFRREEPSQAKSACEVVIGDLRDSAAMKHAAAGCEAVVHLAGKAHALDEGHSDERAYESINVEGTRHVLEGATAAGVQSFIFSSSVKVFGETTEGCVDESQLPAPQTAYGRSKWAAEQLIQQYSERPPRFRGVSLRLPMVYGPTEKGSLFRMIKAIDHGRFPPLPPLPGVRSMLHVRTFTQTVLRLLKVESPLRPCYIVADPAAYNVTTIYELLCAGLGKSVPAWRVPLWLLETGAAVGDLLHSLTGRNVPFTRANLSKLVAPAWYSSGAIVRDLGYQSSLSFKDAVPGLIAFYRRSQS